MKAIRVHAPGLPEALRYEEVPLPEPGPGQLRVRLEAIGVNFRDVYLRLGVLGAALPATPGQEGAGVVEALGAGVEGFARGDAVVWTGVPGAYAEQALVPAARAVARPPGLDARTAAAVMTQGLTAHYLSHDTFPLGPGHRALVHAGAGGVGLLLIQLAKLRGATVLTTVSSAEKAALAREAGADHAIDYVRDDFAAEIRRLTGGAGVDVVYDSVGASTFAGSLAALKARGACVLYGHSSGKVPPFDLYRLADLGSLWVTRPHLHDHIHSRADLLARTEAVLALVSSGRLRVRIGQTFPLAAADAAHRALESRRSTGKLLLLP